MRPAHILLTLLAALAALASAAYLTFRPDPRDQLRASDALFRAGRFHESLAAYRALTTQHPEFAPAYARLGMVHTLRGEAAPAVAAFAAALGRGLGGDDYELVRLYQGALAARSSAYGDPERLWALLAPRSPLRGLEHVLDGERRLAQGDYAGAEQALRAGLAAGLPAGDWQLFARSRLALLRASSDPQSAAAELAALDAPDRSAQPRAAVILAQPLAPPAGDVPARLRGALRADPQAGQLLLGQIYLEQRLYPLAEAQFAAVDARGPYALPAAAYSAYTRWLSGDRAGGVMQLRALVEEHPDEPRARALLAVAVLGTGDPATTRDQLELVRALAPGDPSTHLAWGQWYIAQREYLDAAAAYRRALDRAALPDRATYALHLARFHLDSSLEVCESGLPAAEAATQSDPALPAAWTVLARARLACGDAPGARDAAERATALAPRSPEAFYQLGRSLAAQGDGSGARRALIEAADLEPAGPWRARAELELASLGL